AGIDDGWVTTAGKRSAGATCCPGPQGKCARREATGPLRPVSAGLLRLTRSKDPGGSIKNLKSGGIHERWTESVAPLVGLIWCHFRQGTITTTGAGDQPQYPACQNPPYQ